MRERKPCCVPAEGDAGHAPGGDGVLVGGEEERREEINQEGNVRCCAGCEVRKVRLARSRRKKEGRKERTHFE